MPLQRTLLACCLSVSFSAFATPAGDLPLMPWPQQVELPRSGGAYQLTPQLTLHISGDHLEGAETRWLSRIARQTGWPLLPTDASDEKATIRVQIKEAVDPLPQPDSDESYQLEATSTTTTRETTTWFSI